MGMGFTRDKIVQALIQTHNNIDHAVNLLIEWQANDMGGNEDAKANIDDGVSSGDSDNDEFNEELILRD